MIRINLGPEPVWIAHNIKDKIDNYIAEFYNNEQHILNQKRINFARLGPRLREYEEFLLKELAVVLNGKCIYCESKSPFLEKDTFRPMNGATNFKKEFSPNHYGWLAYTWGNVYLACSTCNKNKKNIFPLNGERAPLLMELPLIYETEDSLLVDPGRENPADHFVFEHTGRLEPITEKGITTEKLLHLNSNLLVEQRREAITQFKRECVTLLKLIKGYNNDAKTNLPEIENIVHSLRVKLDIRTGEYVAFLRACFDSFIERNPEISTFLISTNGWVEILKEERIDLPVRKADIIESQIKQEIDYLNKKWITRIKTSHLREIHDFDISFNIEKSENANWLMLLGENSTGKSTILQAVGLALMSDAQRKTIKIDASKFLRPGEEAGYMKVYLSDDEEPRTLLFYKNRKSFGGTKHNDDQILVFGYGPVRLITPEGKKRRSVTNTLKNLYDPFYTLAEVNAWLTSLSGYNTAWYEAAARTIKSLLPDIKKDSNATLQPDDSNPGKHIIVDYFKNPIAMDELSSGYKNMVTLVCDILNGLQKHFPDSSGASGIVLLDEIDSNLHPRWKMKIVGSLREEFKYIQFITSTHDPLCLRGLKEGEVAVLKKTKKSGSSRLIMDLPSPEGLRVDQLLTSEFFGLNSTIDETTERLFTDYYYLLSQRDLKANQKEQLADIQSRLDELKYLGNSPRERLMYEAIDEYLSKTETLGIQELQKLMLDETKQKISDIWRRVENREGNR